MKPGASKRKTNDSKSLWAAQTQQKTTQHNIRQNKTIPCPYSGFIPTCYLDHKARQSAAGQFHKSNLIWPWHQIHRSEIRPE